ncbi:hypothetical protein [Azospirillum sp.]|uniref:hypothetical protein n=1 Tax=Azospirillum sp. TaxID=34012 RepID=UPI002D63134D|nr:hypothetical protein [Azospirillum sp.]HYD69868.1 hypothetical protein [Azospirillum sp.]
MTDAPTQNMVTKRTLSGLRRRLAALLALALLAGALVALDAGRAVVDGTLRPELAETAELIGANVAQQIDRALTLGVPLDGLVGVEELFAEVVAGNPLVEAMTLRDGGGRVLAAHRSDLAADVTATVPVGGGRASLLVGLRAPDAGSGALWLRLALVAAVVLLAGQLALWWAASRSLERPLRIAARAADAFAAGDVHHRVEAQGSGAALHLLLALGGLGAATRRRAESLRRTIAEVRASHFDPPILAELQGLDERVQATLAPRKDG